MCDRQTASHLTGVLLGCTITIREMLVSARTEIRTIEFAPFPYKVLFQATVSMFNVYKLQM